ncbi:MAG: hypothetical protein ACI85O_002510 [Saprospiraceae bacterium]|jgi:hypothetical protein
MIDTINYSIKQKFHFAFYQTDQHKILSHQQRFRAHSLITARKKLPWQSNYPFLGQFFIKTIIKI